MGSESPNESTSGNGHNSQNINITTNSIGTTTSQTFNTIVKPSAKFVTSTTLQSNNHFTNSIACIKNYTNNKAKSCKVNITLIS